MDGWKVAVICISINIFLGILLFEWCWFMVKPLREVDEKRDSKYPAFRRLDAPKWRKWKFYPGAITLLPIRMIFSILLVLTAYLASRILSIGHNYAANKPMGRYRYAILTCIF